jgi:hypothetical protein
LILLLIDKIKTPMDERQSKKARKLAAKDHPSQEEEEAMTATLEKARLKEVRVVQPTPLEPPPSFDQPPGDLGTAAPSPSAFPDGMAAQDDFAHGDHYGGYQATAFNSSAVNDRELDARNEYHYQQGLHARAATSSVQGYPAQYSAPFYQADAYGRDHRASPASAREIPHPALDRMERIMQGIERASTASSLAIQKFVGQGEFYRFC